MNIHKNTAVHYYTRQLSGCFWCFTASNCITSYAKNGVKYCIKLKLTLAHKQDRAVKTRNLADHDVAKFRRQGEYPEQFNFTQSRLQQLIVRCHSVVGDVVMTCNPAKLCHLQSTTQEKTKSSPK